jgi:DNA-binding transcriptional MerR regulator
MTQALSEGLTIAEAAERTGVSVHTLRYYERIGALLRPPERAPSGHRRYTERDIGWITLLTRLRSTGMPISTLLRYAALAREGESSAGERKALLIAHRAEVADRITRLEHDLAAIDYKINAYEEIERNQLLNGEACS